MAKVEARGQLCLPDRSDKLNWKYYMCGIAGIVAEGAGRYEATLVAMLDSLKHRGPDGSGLKSFGNCILGHRRLSIVDLDTGGQPMCSPVSGAAVTFNGEIYGYKEIKRVYSDYPFRTASDTEVILALYDKYGAGLLSHLPGMFAFAVWDDTRQELFCARDRFGEKPFFYAIGKGGEFVFASEIKAIIKSGLVKPILDMDMVRDYMKRLYVHPSRTIYKNIFTLPPASNLVYANQATSCKKYWRLPETNRDMSLDEAMEEFDLLLDRAVKSQLVADVPVGAFLSGGLDSSTVVSIASQYKSDLMTFSFGFENAAELPYAREVANLYATNHIELTDDEHDVARLLIEMQSIYDEPFADSSNIPTYLISRLARGQSKVILTGDGGDELLAGYDFWYRPLLQVEKLLQRGGPSAYRKWFLRLLGMLPSSFRGSLKDEVYAMRKIDAGKTLAGAHYLQNQFFTDSQLDKMGMGTSAAQPAFRNDNTNTVDDALRMDLEDYMPGDILVKIDRASMAHGLELRAPFLDVDFASFCISLPSRLKIDSRRDKLILREVFQDRWPESIRRRPKQGFGAPVDAWLKRESVRRLKQEYLDDPSQLIYEFISFEAAAPYVARDDYRTWILLVLAIWLNTHEFQAEGC